MADSDSEVTGACKTKLDIFDVNKPEGKRILNLRNTYDRIILQQLLNVSLECATASAGAFDQKSCFNMVKLNGKATWAPPTEKSPSD